MSNMLYSYFDALSVLPISDINGVIFYIICCAFSAYFLQIFKWRWRFRSITTLNGPKSLPLIGTDHIFFSAKTATDVHRLLERVIDSYLLPMRLLWIGNPVYITMDPTELEIIMNHPAALKKGFVYKIISKVSKQGIFSADVPKWKKARKAILPSFNQNILKSFHPIIVEKCYKLCKCIETKALNGSFDLFHVVDRILTETICATFMGVDNVTYNFSELSHRGLELTILRTVKPLYYLDFIYKHTKMAAEENAASAESLRFTNEIIATRRRNRSNEKLQTVNSKKKPFLDLLLDLVDQQIFTEENIRDEVLTLLYAGTDTSTTALSFILLCLGMHQNIQDKVYEEVVQVVGLDKEIDISDLSKLKYTEMVIKEVLRLFPVGPLILREITSQIKLNKLTLPEGTAVLIPIAKIQRNPEFWEDPLEFIPERFTPEEIAKKPSFAYIPFSAGPRDCIGKTYGMMSLKVFLATIIQNFKIYTDYKSIEDVKLNVTMTIQPTEGFKCSFQCRKQQLFKAN